MPLEKEDALVVLDAVASQISVEERKTLQSVLRKHPNSGSLVQDGNLTVAGEVFTRAVTHHVESLFVDKKVAGELLNLSAIVGEKWDDISKGMSEDDMYELFKLTDKNWKLVAGDIMPILKEKVEEVVSLRKERESFSQALEIVAANVCDAVNSDISPEDVRKIIIAEDMDLVRMVSFDGHGHPQGALTKMGEEYVRASAAAIDIVIEMERQRGEISPNLKFKFQERLAADLIEEPYNSYSQEKMEEFKGLVVDVLTTDPHTQGPLRDHMKGYPVELSRDAEALLNAQEEKMAKKGRDAENEGEATLIALKGNNLSVAEVLATYGGKGAFQDAAIAMAFTQAAKVMELDARQEEINRGKEAQVADVSPVVDAGPVVEEQQPVEQTPETAIVAALAHNLGKPITKGSEERFLEHVKKLDIPLEDMVVRGDQGQLELTDQGEEVVGMAVRSVTEYKDSRPIPHSKSEKDKLSISDARFEEFVDRFQQMEVDSKARTFVAQQAWVAELVIQHFERKIELDDTAKEAIRDGVESHFYGVISGMSDPREIDIDSRPDPSKFLVREGREFRLNDEGVSFAEEFGGKVIREAKKAEFKGTLSKHEAEIAKQELARQEEAKRRASRPAAASEPIEPKEPAAGEVAKGHITREDALKRLGESGMDVRQTGPADEREEKPVAERKAVSGKKGLRFGKEAEKRWKENREALTASQEAKKSIASEAANAASDLRDVEGLSDVAKSSSAEDLRKAAEMMRKAGLSKAGGEKGKENERPAEKSHVQDVEARRSRGESSERTPGS